jgi:hypothetical protein
MIHLLILWIINFVQIVLIGYQTKNITNNKYHAAMITQFTLSIVQVMFVYLAVAASIFPACLVMGTSGAIGILVGMFIYKFF